MSNKFFSIFGICAILLGAYILVSAFLGTDSNIENYHIGCYLTNNTHNHHYEITTALNKIKSKKQTSKAKFNINRALIQSNRDLREKSVRIAKDVQNYIQKIVISGAHQKNNQQFYFQLQNALNQYQICQKYFKENFDSQDCKDNWQSYKQCSKQMHTSKQEIQKHIIQRDMIHGKINKTLNKKDTNQSKPDIEGLLKQIQNKYKKLNEENDKNQRQSKSKLTSLQNMIHSSKLDLQQTQSQLKSVKFKYQSCFANLRDFNACKNLTSALDSYGYNQTQTELQQRIKNKRITLKKLQEIPSSQAKQLFNKGIEQLKSMLKLRIQIHQQKKNSKCGCTEEQQKQLQLNKKNTETQITNIKNKLNQMEIQTSKLKNTLKSLIIRRQNLLDDQTKQISDVMSMKTDGESSHETLQKYKNQLKIINQNILRYEKTLNSLQFQCNQIKDRLALRFNQTDSLKECLVKKDYYLKLKSKQQQILYLDPSNEAAKTQLLKSLNAIQFQKSIQNKNQVLIQQINQDSQNKLETLQQVSKIIQETIKQSVNQKQLVSEKPDEKKQQNENDAQL